MNRKLHPINAVSPNEVILSGNVVIGASGAITSQTGAADAGFTATKESEDGRYSVSFPQTYRKFKSGKCSMAFASVDDAFPTDEGLLPHFRGEATTSSAVVQFIRPDTAADANPASGCVLYLRFVMIK